MPQLLSFAPGLLTHLRHFNACLAHGPACIAFHCSHPYITNHGSVSHFAKTWVTLQTTTYKSKNTKYFGINLLLTGEQLLHAPPVQIGAQNSTILTPNNLVIFCQAHVTNWLLATKLKCACVHFQEMVVPREKRFY
mgnify:CR=1 FL=1